MWVEFNSLSIVWFRRLLPEYPLNVEHTAPKLTADIVETRRYVSKKKQFEKGKNICRVMTEIL